MAGRHMKVTVLVASLASNGISRAGIIVELLRRHYDVEVFGRLRSGEEVFPWHRDFPWQVVRADGLPEAIRAMSERVTGDVVMASSVAVTSFGVGLLAKLRRRIPLVLDMPEWEAADHYGWRPGLPRALMVARSLVGPGWGNAHSFKYRYLLDKVTGLADERTVCCDFLRRRYGGVFLPHGVPTDQFDPARFDRQAIRRKWNIPADATTLFFGGNPQPKKGLEEALAAVEALGDKVNARLVIVGRDESHPYTKRLVDAGRGRVMALGPQPYPLMPEFLATADIVALPQTSEPKSQGYVACKMYEAMSMEIPVISTDVSDNAEILRGCGYIVPPEQPAALQARIEHVLTHPEEAREMGRRARQRAIDRYSWDVMDRALQDVMESVRPGGRGRPGPVTAAQRGTAASSR
jgi:glycosyltransferase involved in cell wall biosynthesis